MVCGSVYGGGQLFRMFVKSYQFRSEISVFVQGLAGGEEEVEARNHSQAASAGFECQPRFSMQLKSNFQKEVVRKQIHDTQHISYHREVNAQSGCSGDSLNKSQQTLNQLYSNSQLVFEIQPRSRATRVQYGSGRTACQLSTSSSCKPSGSNASSGGVKVRGRGVRVYSRKGGRLGEREITY